MLRILGEAWRGPNLSKLFAEDCKGTSWDGKGWICLVLVPGGYVKQLRVFEDFPEKF